jgi:hypothetical protein
MVVLHRAHQPHAEVPHCAEQQRTSHRAIKAQRDVADVASRRLRGILSAAISGCLEVPTRGSTVQGRVAVDGDLDDMIGE